jgi:hypothetical protein
MGLVIAGVIFAVGAALTAFFFDWWPTIIGSVTAACHVLVQQTSVPNWLLGLLVVIAVVFTLRAVGAVIRRRPNWRSYTEDTFFGLVWRWRYSIVIGEGIPVDLTSFCPYCDFQVHHEPASGHRAVEGIAYHCDGCGRALGTVNESVFSLHNKVERLIQQKLRNGAWTTSVSSCW